jgi:hypothetical protein
VSRPARALAVVAAMTVSAACTGENLFTHPGTGGTGAPSVMITAPTPGYSIAVGDSILVMAEVNAPAGGGAVIYRGTYGNGVHAYLEEPANMNGINIATLATYLVPVGTQVGGTAWIAVEVEDVGGVAAVDSVEISIIP